MSSPGSLSYFIQKLKQKNQSERQVAQAKEAINLFYRLIQSNKRNASQSFVQTEVDTKKHGADSTEVYDVSETKAGKVNLKC